MSTLLPTNQKGISLVEILLVLATLGILVAIISNLPNALGLIGRSRHQSLAREIAAKAVEDVRAISYINLTSGTISISDSRINLLPSASGTRLIEDCPSSICAHGENTKQITVTVKWREVTKEETIKLVTLVSQGGLNQ